MMKSRKAKTLTMSRLFNSKLLTCILYQTQFKSIQIDVNSVKSRSYTILGKKKDDRNEQHQLQNQNRYNFFISGKITHLKGDRLHRVVAGISMRQRLKNHLLFHHFTHPRPQITRRILPYTLNKSLPRTPTYTNIYRHTHTQSNKMHVQSYVELEK